MASSSRKIVLHLPAGKLELAIATRDVVPWAQDFGGFDHYGFFACREGAEPRFGGTKLVEGLYYYSE